MDEEYVMNRIVVTGATSMIGVALIEEAIKNNVKVLAIVRENSLRINRLPKSDLIEIVSCDIEELDSFPQIKEKYDVFYHFAWNYTDKGGRNNPILQAKMLNEAKTDLNIVMGLCVGHDSLFYKYVEGLTTTMVVKDRVTGHNPAAVLYNAESYYKSKLFRE